MSNLGANHSEKKHSHEYAYKFDAYNLLLKVIASVEVLSAFAGKYFGKISP